MIAKVEIRLTVAKNKDVRNPANKYLVHRALAIQRNDRIVIENRLGAQTRTARSERLQLKENLQLHLPFLNVLATMFVSRLRWKRSF